MATPAKTVIRGKERKSISRTVPPVREDSSNIRATKVPSTAPAATRRKVAPAGAAGASPAANTGPKSKKDDAENFVAPVKDYVKPLNQLQLSEAELAEELACSLTAANPAAPANIARYQPRDGIYKVEHGVDQMLQHYSADGWLAYKEPAPVSRPASVRSQAQSTSKDASEAPADAQADTETERLRNQFNFNDRASQTTIYAPQNVSTMTEPPPSQAAGGSTTQWEIFDAYRASQEKAKAAEDQAKARSVVARKGAASAPDEQTAAELAAKEKNNQDRQAVGRMAQLVERMCHQNIQQDIISDFKYWDDPADGIQEREGTLLPLWRFTAGAAHGRHVTALSWNPAYPDLFAAGYGSFDAQRQGTGAVLCFSLKDPATPAFERQTPSGVMCLDFQPQQAHILAVGLYSGAIEVHNVLAKHSQPLYRATAATGKHADAVFAIRWLSGLSAGLRGLVFYSASADGTVLQWILGQSSMSCQDFFVLPEPTSVTQAAKATALDNVAHSTAPPYGATCMDFHKDQGHIVLVGTEDGRMHRCSTALAAEALSTYRGHADAVYAVHWNRRHPDVFLSSSADWTVKLWLADRDQAVMTFDLGCPVGDAAWAPYSASVFAGVGEDGRVQVFDLAANKTEPLSRQKIHPKAGLTRLAFNAHHPILLIGDDRGCVHCLKLSPNLRRQPKGAAGQAADASVLQLDAIFSVALKSMVLEAEA